MSNQGPSIEAKSAHVISTATVSGSVLYGGGLVTNYLKENWLPEMAIPALNFALNRSMQMFNKPVVKEVLELEENQRATGFGLAWQSAKEYDFVETARGLGQAGVDFMAGKFLSLAGSQLIIPVVSSAITENMSSIIPEEYQAMAAIAANVAVAGAYFTASEMAKPVIKEQTYPLVDKILGDRKLERDQVLKISLLAKRLEQLKKLEGKKENMKRLGYSENQAQNLNKEAKEVLEDIRQLREKLSKDKIPIPKEPQWQNLEAKRKNKAVLPTHDKQKQVKQQHKQPQPKKSRKKSPKGGRRKNH